ncbi:CCAAT/enhancer-binding protein gamma [Halotydeus destructor]|nr:CCAAT/enhancer-binding protein gamma [Halotydeus destructor]
MSSMSGQATSVNGYSSEGSSDGAGPDGSRSGRRKTPLDKNSDEYRKRRERNNEAVKKSRSKAKEKTQATVERVNKLQAENSTLHQRIEVLSKEFDFLKDLLNSHGVSEVDNCQPDARLMQFQDYQPIKQEHTDH